MNEKESLDLITRMINNTRKGIEKNAALPMLIFGYASMITSLAVWLALSLTGNYWFHILWAAIPLLGWSVLGLLKAKRSRGEATPGSYIGRIIAKMWYLLAGVMVLCMIVPFIVRGFPVAFVMTLLVAIGVSCSGLFVRYLPFIVCGFAGILLSFAFLWIEGIVQSPVLALMFLIIMVIPGHMLQAANNKNIKNA